MGSRPSTTASAVQAEDMNAFVASLDEEKMKTLIANADDATIEKIKSLLEGRKTAADALLHHQEAKLPPELENFNVLAETATITAITLDPAFVAAQANVQEKPGDETSRAALSDFVSKLNQAITDAVQARLNVGGDVPIKSVLRKVIYAGNKDFLQVYESVWNLISGVEKEAIREYTYAVIGLRNGGPLDKTKETAGNSVLRQTAKDASVLYQHAASIHHQYISFVLEHLVDDMEVKTSLPSKLKKMGRIIEKSILKRPDDPGNSDKVCDIVRGMITCPSMAEVAKLVRRLEKADLIVLTRCKDRFLEAPSAGGWRDCMLNFYLKSDPKKHICELQLVHAQMLTARKGLPGHAVYNRVRNASELLGICPNAVEQPQTREELQEWLKNWDEQKKGIKLNNGALEAHGSPGEWDVSKITNMANLFSSARVQFGFNEDISRWDVRNVTTMNSMFYSCEDFNQDITKWNTKNVTDYMYMFGECQIFKQDISCWDTGKAGKNSQEYVVQVAKRDPTTMNKFDIE